MATVRDEKFGLAAKTPIQATVASEGSYISAIGYVISRPAFLAWVATRPDVDGLMYLGSAGSWWPFNRTNSCTRNACYCWAGSGGQPCQGTDYSDTKPQMLHLMCPIWARQWSNTSLFWGVRTPSPLPVSSFYGTPLSGYAPLTVSFVDTSTGEPTSWLWNFGDGLLSAEQNPTHVYSSAGVYTVVLSVTNASGTNTITKTNYITAIDPPPYVNPVWTLKIGPLLVI